MTLGFFILATMAVAALFYLGIGLAAVSSGQSRLRNGAERMAASVVIVVALGLATAARPIDFGVDTIAYLRFYDQYCFSRSSDLELSYDVTFGLLNLFQAGLCSPNALIATWIGVILICFLLLPDDLATRLKLAALTIMSLIGIELATNALRQGVSAAVMMLAFAWYRNNRPVGIVLGILSLGLHGSAGLVLMALVIAHLRPSYFLVSLAALIALVMSYSYLGLTIVPLDRLTNEINKYAVHEADDLYIRGLAAAQLFVTLVLAGMASRRGSDSVARADVGIAIRLGLTALPYLTLPYIGYRYVYGIFVIALYLCRRSLVDDRRLAFELLVVANVFIVLVWSLGSSHLSQIRFLAL